MLIDAPSTLKSDICSTNVVDLINDSTIEKKQLRNRKSGHFQTIEFDVWRNDVRKKIWKIVEQLHWFYQSSR